MNRRITERVENIEQQLLEFLKRENEEGLQNLLPVTHPADLALVFENLSSSKAAELSNYLSQDKLVEILSLISPTSAAQLLRRREKQSFENILPEMPPDDAADLFLTLTKAEQESLLAGIENQEFRRNLVDLVSYPHDTAGGVMTTEYLAVDETETVDEVLALIREAPDEAELVYYVYTLDEDKCLTGVVSLRKLLQVSGHKRLRDLIHKDLFKVRVDVPRAEALELIDRYELLSLPVVDYQDRLRGVITADDAVEMLEQEMSESLLRREGIAPLEGIDRAEGMLPENSSLWTTFSLRLPWLVVVSLGGLLAASTLGYLGEELLIHRQLLYFLPLVLGLSSAAASQASALVGQPGLLKKISSGPFFLNLLRELFFTGLGVGVFLALLVGGLVWCWKVYLLAEPLGGDTIIFATAVGIATAAVVLSGALTGFLLARLVRFFNLDPAYANNPLLISVQYVLSVLVYIWVVSLFPL